MTSKNVIVALGAALVAAAVSVFVYANNGMISMDDIFDANVEALSQIEHGEYVRCWGTIHSDSSETVFYCGTCSCISGRWVGGMDFCK